MARLPHISFASWGSISETTVASGLSSYGAINLQALMGALQVLVASSVELHCENCRRDF